MTTERESQLWEALSGALACSTAYAIRRRGGVFILERAGRAPVVCATREQAWAIVQGGAS